MCFNNRLALVVMALMATACGQAGDATWDFLTTDETTENFIVVGSTDTFFKKSTVDSSSLQIGSEKCTLESGQKILLKAAPDYAGAHFIIVLEEALPGCEFTRGFVFRDHIQKTSLKSLFSANMKAFLDTIAYAEGTDDSYDYIFSYVKFYSFAGHPRRLICSGGYCSDAAGRYQFKSTTWDEVRRVVGLTDFSPESQDRAAVQLIKWRGGYDDVERISDFSSFNNAAYTVRFEWASMPHSPYGQPTHSASSLWSKFKQFKDRY
ncbi:MAG: lysozyme [Betaproteobacteria bacterium]|nr:lysozyme [Betaproteobacteria bacterium]